jgi:hypothetical protein
MFDAREDGWRAGDGRRWPAMAGERYEYKVLVEYISPETKGQYPHFSRIEDQEGLTKTLCEIFDRLPDYVPEGRDVVSHNITESRSTLVVTVLLRRPVAKPVRRRAKAVS